MRIELITTGDELMSGLTLDRNFNWAGDLLSTLGFDFAYHTTVGDIRERIAQAFDIASKRADAVIVTGGLGPTDDDLTAEVAAEYFGSPLEFKEDAYHKLEAWLRGRGREVNESNKKQVYLPECSEVLENNWGTAPGFSIDSGGVIFFFLPGVPREFHEMTRAYVVPELERRSSDRPKRAMRLVKLYGLPESEVAERLKGLHVEGVTLGYRSHRPEIHLRVMSFADTEPEAENLTQEYIDGIVERIGDYVFTTDGELLEEVVGRLLKENSMTLATAESCTGGLLANRITDVPGSSEYFLEGVISYSNEAKEDLLDVPLSVLEAHGAVSGPVVEAMAKGVRTLSGSDIGIGISGIAGPGGGTAEKPVGTVYIGLDTEGVGAISRKFQFSGTREQIKAVSSEAALDIIMKLLKSIE